MPHRKTKIISPIQEFCIEDIIPNVPWAIVITQNGYVKRMSLEYYKKQNRGGKGISGAEVKEDDIIEHFFIATAHQYLLIFTNLGRAYWLKVYDIPELTRNARGRAIVNILQLQPEETITSIIPITELSDKILVMITAQGLIKQFQLTNFRVLKKAECELVQLLEGDN